MPVSEACAGYCVSPHLLIGVFLMVVPLWKTDISTARRGKKGTRKTTYRPFLLRNFAHRIGAIHPHFGAQHIDLKGG